MATLKRKKLTPQQEEWLAEKKVREDAVLKQHEDSLKAEEKVVTRDNLASEWSDVLIQFAASQLEHCGDRLKISRDASLIGAIRDFSKLYWKAAMAERVAFIAKYRIGIRNALAYAGMLGFPT